MNGAELSIHLPIISAGFGIGRLFGVVLYSKECARPKLGKRPDPSFVYLPDRNDIQRIDASASLFTSIYQPRRPQSFDVLHDCKSRHVRKRLDYLRRRFGPEPQQIEDRPARRVRKCLPNMIEVVCHCLGLCSSRLRKIVHDEVEHSLPAGRDVFTVLRIDHPDHSVPQGHFCAVWNLLEFHLDMIYCWI